MPGSVPTGTSSHYFPNPNANPSSCSRVNGIAYPVDKEHVGDEQIGDEQGVEKKGDEQGGENLDAD